MRVIVAVLLAAQVAAAQPSDKVTREFQAGVDAFRLGKHDEARKHLERARELDPGLPGPNRFLAAVARAQGRFDDCVAASRVAIELNPASREIADTRKLHDDCRRADGRPAFAQALGDRAAIGVITDIAGATVRISGLVYGATPLEPRPVPAGSHDVELTKAGYLPAKLIVYALPGIVTDVEVELAVDPGAQSSTESGTKVVPRATGTIVIAGGRDGDEVWIDGQLAAGTTIEASPGIHVIEVRRAGGDPWRRRVTVAAERGAELTPTLIDTAARERTRTKGLWLTAAGVGLIAGGAVTLVIGSGGEQVSRRAFYGLGGGAVGLGAVVLGFGVVSLSRGRRPDLTAPPPLAISPFQGGVIASTGLVF